MIVVNREIPPVNVVPNLAEQRMMVLAVHPDDESLAAGGLIQRARAEGATVRVILVTDGDNNPWPQRVLERRWTIDANARARWGTRRRAEAFAALLKLGVDPGDISCWGFPDQGLTDLLCRGPQELRVRLATEILQWRPTLLVAPSICDHHPDHSALGVLVHSVLTDEARDAASALTRLDYIVHPRPAKTCANRVTLALSPAQVTRKLEAIFCHRTQVALSRARFRRYADAQEIFLLSQPLPPSDPDHPLISADYCGGVLRLTLRRIPAGAKLLLLADSPGSQLGLSITFSLLGPATLRDHASGECLGRVERRYIGDHEELLVYAPLFSAVETVAVKIVCGRNLYDRSGWCLLPLPAGGGGKRGQGPAKRPGAVCVIIPCYNIAAVCGAVVRQAADFSDHVIAINDGSTDDTSAILHEAARHCGGKITVIDLPTNQGKGSVLMEGFRRALALDNVTAIVTLDGDGQHRPADLPRLTHTLQEGECALVIGERLAQSDMPFRSMLGNVLTSCPIRVLHPAAPVDTQSGFRAFHPAFVREVVETMKGGRYETELKILLLALRRSRRIGSVIIPTVYLNGNRLSHFRPLIDSWRIYRTLLGNYGPSRRRPDSAPAATANREQPASLPQSGRA
jgi:LmbE family N-acetylglucosaminyl deacetylase